MRKDPALFTGTGRVGRPETLPPGMRLALRKPRQFALGALTTGEEAQLAAPGKRLHARVRRLLRTMLFAAAETTSEGARIWRIAVHSPGSRGLRVEFENFSVGAGQVWVHDGVHVVGQPPACGTFGDGHFWSGSLASNAVSIEYQPASGVVGELEPPFTIRAISHQARTLLDAAATTAPADPADYCELDVNCYSPWPTAATSVGQISFMDGGDEYVCSGALVATRDNSFIPYFLTAGHCINNEAAARTVEAYWTYQTSSCGAAPPASRDSSLKSSVGGHLISWGTIPQGDFSLVLLPDVPAGVTFSGWDIADPPYATDLTSIHHPSGSWKRVSFGQRTDDATVDVGGLTAPDVSSMESWNKVA